MSIGEGFARGILSKRKGKLMQEKIERHLDLTIRINNGEFEVEVYEPESGEIVQFQHPLSFDEHREFDEAIGQEIYSWLSLWSEEDAE